MTRTVYKLIGSKENETPNETIIRCANNLTKALVAAGYNLHSIPGLSGFEVAFYDHVPGEIIINNTLSNWTIKGKCPIKISFKPTDKELSLDE